MNVVRKGAKLYDPYFHHNVVVLGTGIWTDPKYITGRYYRVKHPYGTIMDTHENAFIRPWLRKRDQKGRFMKRLW